jgi:Tol biopolymer transport system component
MNPFPFRFGESGTLGYSDNQVNAVLPIWSPDSQFLLIEDNQQSESTTYLFDIQNHKVTSVAENARPVSWMK